METIKISLSIYALTIVCSLLVALVIRGLGGLVKWLNLDRSGEQPDLTVPSADSIEEERAIAVAIAAASAAEKRKRRG
ncbi:MAG: hypothetical protein D6781_06905 [Verrucomicrobia bacterium]|nr:MAG: hypothetical protein D6781_06905 [Verrucomicrobiota bacterium]